MGWTPQSEIEFQLHFVPPNQKVLNWTVKTFLWFAPPPTVKNPGYANVCGAATRTKTAPTILQFLFHYFSAFFFQGIWHMKR